MIMTKGKNGKECNLIENKSLVENIHVQLVKGSNVQMFVNTLENIYCS